MFVSSTVALRASPGPPPLQGAMPPAMEVAKQSRCTGAWYNVLCMRYRVQCAGHLPGEPVGDPLQLDPQLLGHVRVAVSHVRDRVPGEKEKSS